MPGAPTAQPLLLDSRGHGQATGWRNGEHLIDALPYIDPLQPDMKLKVDALVEEELKRSVKQPADYLKEMPSMPAMRFEGHPLLAAEYERVKSKQPMPALDTTRYALAPPAQAKKNDQAAWRSALDNANAQLEHHAPALKRGPCAAGRPGPVWTRSGLLRILNMELLLKFGGNTWRAQAQLSEATVKQYELELANTKKKIDNVNRERKLQQMAAGSELRKLDVEYYEVTAKNAEIEAACCRLEEEVHTLAARLEQRTAQEAAAAAAAAATTATAAAPAPAAGADAQAAAEQAAELHPEAATVSVTDAMDAE